MAGQGGRVAAERVQGRRSGPRPSMPRHGRSASRPGPGRSGPVRPAFGPGVPLRPSSTRRRQDGAKAQVTRILRPLSCPAQAPTGRPSPGSLPQGSTSPYSTATSRAASPASARSSAASLTAGPGSAWLSDRTRPASCSACSQPSSTARLGGRGQLSLVVDSTCGVHHGAGRPHLDRSGVTPWRRRVTARYDKNLSCSASTANP